MSEVKNEQPDAKVEPVPAAAVEPVAEASAPKRKVSKAKATVTLRNLTRRVVVAMDAKGSGIHLFPGVEVELEEALIGPDIHRKAQLGLIALD